MSKLRYRLALWLAPDLARHLTTMADTIKDLSVVMANSKGIHGLMKDNVPWNDLTNPDHYYGWLGDMHRAKTSAAEVRYHIKPWELL